MSDASLGYVVSLAKPVSCVVLYVLLYQQKLHLWTDMPKHSRRLHNETNTALRKTCFSEHIPIEKNCVTECRSADHGKAGSNPLGTVVNYVLGYS